MQSLIIRDHMQHRPLSLHPEMPIATAVEKLLAGQQTGAPVVDSGNRLVGFVSEQDFLAKLIECSYHCETVAKVSESLDMLPPAAQAQIVGDTPEGRTGYALAVFLFAPIAVIR